MLRYPGYSNCRLTIAHGSIISLVTGGKQSFMHTDLYLCLYKCLTKCLLIRKKEINITHILFYQLKTPGNVFIFCRIGIFCVTMTEKEKEIKSRNKDVKKRMHEEVKIN